jgi:ubiquinone/menaquinone biosynthesis C-methylase UbiE
MSARAARLFAHVQAAEFYRRVHDEAAGLFHTGEDLECTWLDVGCGPGILTRIAASKGYRAHGIDRDPDMITAARALVPPHETNCIFEVLDLDAALSQDRRFDIVSASSLLVVMQDPAAALRKLIALTKPGGKVLVIEASQKMSLPRAFSLILTKPLGTGAYMLAVWAFFRSGRTLPTSMFHQREWHASYHSLLYGQVNAWIVEEIG